MGGISFDGGVFRKKILDGGGAPPITPTPQLWETLGGIHQQIMEKQVCKDALTGGTTMIGFEFFLY